MKKNAWFYWCRLKLHPTTIIVIVGFSFLCSCKKSEKEDISSAANGATRAIDVGVSNWMTTNGLNWQTNSKILVAVEKLTEATKMSLTNDVYLESGAAALFLKRLLDQGLLPGVSKGEHGDMTSDMVDSVISNKAVAMTYPASRTFRLVKDGETSTNNYILLKQSNDSEWKLQKAWLTDSNGQIIKEWP